MQLAVRAFVLGRPLHVSHIVIEVTLNLLLNVLVYWVMWRKLKKTSGSMLLGQRLDLGSYLLFKNVTHGGTIVVYK